MPSIRSLWRYAIVASVLLCALGGAATRSYAVTCEKNHADCQLTVTTSVVTDPSVFCAQGTPIIQVSVSLQCGDELLCSHAVAPRFCGTTNTPITFSACGYSVTVQPKATRNWIDAHASCGDMNLFIQ